jgi:transposase
MPGRVVNRASDGYRGEGKTDARDAYVIADQARMRRDLRPIRFGDEAAIELKLLTGRRSDLVEDRTRVVNRLRGTLLSMFPALERALDVTNTSPLRLLTGYQTPAAIRRSGVTRLTKWLANRKVRNARTLAEAAVEAAERQHTSVPGEKTIAKLVHTLAEEVMALNEQISELDKLIEGRFREHELADIVQSVPGIGTVLGAELLTALGGSLDDFDSPDALAAFAGVAPAPRDSGKVSGKLHRPITYHRRLQRVFYTSALVSVRYYPNSRRFYDRKRAEGKKHVQAVLALARRRVNVLWAPIRDRRCYQVTPSVTSAA